MKTNTVHCFKCGKHLQTFQGDSGLRASGQIVLNLPALVCPDCVDDVLNDVPDPPGLICVPELSESIALSTLSDMNFAQSIGESADFFVGLFPTSAEIRDCAAVRLHQAGEREHAYEILMEGLRDVDDPDPLFVEIGALLGMDGEPMDGLAFLESAAETAVRYHVVKGNLLRKIGRWEEAAECWRKAIKSDTSDVIPWLNLGYYLMKIKEDFVEAKKHYRRACKAFPTVRRFRAFLGDTLFFQGKSSDAMKHYKRALAIPDSDPDFETSLREMMSKCG